ncbi:hypothetical protein VKT23_015765 [Stygiomarasmius scandens]|uniref:Uncharacterized protein n=1 Tax=Marasmiellus scandens TaxID=2682957 RepID=A0ABR1J0V9_9AGAR
MKLTSVPFVTGCFVSLAFHLVSVKSVPLNNITTHAFPPSALSSVPFLIPPTTRAQVQVDETITTNALPPTALSTVSTLDLPTTPVDVVQTVTDATNTVSPTPLSGATVSPTTVTQETDITTNVLPPIALSSESALDVPTPI